MLQNKFYTLLSNTKTESGVHAVITINPEHEIFEGHFPGKPVVPGVCMIQIVKEILEQEAGRPLLFHKGHQIKFLQLLVPEKETAISVNLTWKIIGSDFQITADFKKETSVVFKLTGLFKAQ